VLSFPGFPDEMRRTDVYGGEVRPMFDDAESEALFYKSIKAGDQIDYRRPRDRWIRAHVMSVSVVGLELRVWTEPDSVPESCPTENIPLRCLPADTVSPLMTFKPALYGTRDAELGIL
jgi:hypothetical protein